MCLIVMKPIESVREQQRDLQRALKLLGEAQMRVAQALEAAAMYESNWRVGAYRERTHEEAVADFQPPQTPTLETD